MNRRFEMGPLLVALGAVLLIVSLFLDWYGHVSAWDAFELVDVLLAALGVMALFAALGSLVPDLGYVDRRWVPAIVLTVAVLIAAEIINPPPAAAALRVTTGAWIGFGAAILMLLGAVLSLGRVSVSVSVAERPVQRVAAVDERQTTTETDAVPVRPAAATEATEPLGPAKPPAGTRAGKR